MKRVLLAIPVSLYLMTGALIAQQSLPIQHIRLYKNGMAYLVRAGQIRAPLSLTFRPNQMNDILKTFTAWNPDSSTLYPVAYTTGIAAEEVLSRFPFDLRESANGLASFLAQIKGADVKVNIATRSLSGRLLAVVPEDHAVQQQTVVKDYRLTLLNAGSVQTVWLSDVRSLELQDSGLADQLKTYLQVLAEGQDPSRTVTVYPSAETGPVNVAYVQQFPVWKTTYRVDLNANDSRIQGWAQIDNPTGESWNSVDLTLVSGMPVSFTMDLYEPLYAARSVMKVPAAIVAAPRQYETAVDNKPETGNGTGRGVGFGEGRGVAGGSYVPRPGLTMTEAVPAEGAATAPPPPAAAQLADSARNQDYFEYRFPFPVQLSSRQSALLPFLNKPIKAERVSIFKSGSDRDHPMNGAWLENNAELPLDAGAVTFFQNGQYAGETVLDYVSRGERRLVSYGIDYDVQADKHVRTAPEVLSKVSVSRGVMTIIRETDQITSYKFRNKGQESKIVILEHARDGQKVLKNVNPEETTAAFYRFRMVIEPGQTTEFPVSETISRRVNVTIRDLSREMFELTVAANNVPAELRNRLETIIKEREHLADLQAQKFPLDQTIKNIFDDQQRLRENLKALGDGREQRELRQKYLTELDAQEAQVKDMRTRIETLAREITDQDARISKLIADMHWE